jgi:hypothetical protein
MRDYVDEVTVDVNRLRARRWLTDYDAAELISQPQAENVAGLLSHSSRTGSADQTRKISFTLVSTVSEVFVDRPDIHTFRYTGVRFDAASGVTTMDYLAEGVDGAQYPFTDVVTFPLPTQLPDPATMQLVEKVVELLYVAAGTVYYKVLAARSVVFDAVQLAPAAHQWAQALYRHGLAEFAYLHNLPHVLDLELSCELSADASSSMDMATDGRRPLVAVGGGKDSIVSIEALRVADLKPTLFAVRRSPLLEEIMALAGLPVLIVDRGYDNRVPRLLRQGGYTGHVPVNATHTLAGVVTSLLHGLGPVVLSNERSASAANLRWRDRDINHQWSKSIEGHTLLHEALKAHAGLSNATFSLLNGMSELHIAQLFAGIDIYDSKVTSCNRAFRLFNRKFDRWCTNCDKCRFVFLALAPFINRARLVSIVGRDLMNDLAQLDGYRELMGLSGHKPLECVGEITESRVALRLLTEHPDWAGSRVVRTLREELTEWPSDAEVAAVFTARSPRFVPKQFAQAISSMQRAVGAPIAV